ncbi:MAG: hypothetical protein HYW57_05585 [Ignavibacteriales bacterium]|nr:hypothetical protein [Ignavibacteriales bacterium]
MFIETNTIVRVLLSILLFPTFFQDAFIAFAWGEGDDFWIMAAKRLFFLLPALAIIAGCWLTTPSILTVIFRHKRREYITALVITWWDLGKSIVSFWGGIFRFVLSLLGALVGLVKMIIIGIWSVIQEILFFPFRLLRAAGQSVVNSPVPWIAVFLTVFWCLIEALIFTYVVSPLVSDTLSNITGEQLSGSLLRIPLFIFLFFIVLGSYAVLSNLMTAVKSKNATSIAGILVIELVVLFVEVVFLYREFVDSLVPWFAQYSAGFELGVFWTLAIACLAWFGIRSLSWFLFAEYGTPTILSIIQGKGLGVAAVPAEEVKTRFVAFSGEFMSRIREDAEWIKAKGDELLAAFMLPPLQVIAATVNFCILLVSGKHLFQLPFTSLESILSSGTILERLASPKSGTTQQV